MNLFELTYDLVRQIPDGKVSTYGAVAKALGDIRASRAVGWMMNQNPDADSMPCFKIVHSDGRLGGFGLGIDDKIRRLNADNILVKDGKLVDFDSLFFDEFNTKFPLKQLHKEQEMLSVKVKTDDGFSEIETVAGIDVAYPNNAFDSACGACVIIDYQTKEILEEKTIFAKTMFPYIPTYLFYREFPVVEKLMKKITKKPSVILFDGNGVLHPKQLGLASHAGVCLKIPTIGVAKRLLYGSVNKDNITFQGKVRGYAFQLKKNIKPVFVSSGHNVSLKTSVEIVKNLSVYKNPEPLRRAHFLAKQTLLESRQCSA